MTQTWAPRALNDLSCPYWLGQLVFWFGLSVVPFLGMTLWYNNLNWLYFVHMFVQAALGLGLSIPLGWCYLRLWEWPLALRMVLVLIVAGATAALWTWLRMVTYVWLTAEQDIWKEYGGWYFGAFYIYLCWSALYHGMRYYHLLDVEHQHRLREMALTKEEQIKRLQAETEARDAQLKMLRYQLNPHFLFNTLNTIYALIKTDERDKAAGMTSKLGQFLRATLDYNPRHHVPLAEEIDTIKSYLDIETERFSDRLQVEYSIEPEARRARVPGLVLQPLIENAIKYAVARSEKGGRILIQARVIEQRLCLDVIDSGPGLATSADSVGRCGIGWRNTLDRLKTLYGDRYAFDLEAQQPHGLRVSVSIPFTQHGVRQTAAIGESNPSQEVV